MNCYYLRTPKHPKTGSKPYFSADVMIVKPARRLSRDTVSYTIGKDGPAPLATIEIMSRRTFKKIDLTVKLVLYERLGIEEYILADPTGKLLPERLLLKRLQPDRSWTDERDEDGSVSSKLGFRLIMDEHGDLTVLDAKTGLRLYPAPGGGSGSRGASQGRGARKGVGRRSEPLAPALE